MVREADVIAAQALREQCRREGREVLTPLAATTLFGISNAAVRTARLSGKVRAELTISVTAKDVHLINLNSALHYWRLREDMRDTLARMRRDGATVSVGSDFYNVLHADEVVKPFQPDSTEAGKPRLEPTRRG